MDFSINNVAQCAIFGGAKAIIEKTNDNDATLFGVENKGIEKEVSAKDLKELTKAAVLGTAGNTIDNEIDGEDLKKLAKAALLGTAGNTIKSDKNDATSAITGAATSEVKSEGNWFTNLLKGMFFGGLTSVKPQK